MQPEVIYEDENYVAINKPALMPVHFDGHSEKPTVVDWVKQKYPDLLGVGGSFVLNDKTETPRFGVVHRLDASTSGVLMVAKNQESFDYLQGQFRKHKVFKVYKAFVYGILKERGTVVLPIGRSKNNFKLWTTGKGVRGALREATTEYTPEKIFKDSTFVEVRPKTGRTHQIRVHLKSIQHPIVCDRLYAPEKPEILGFQRTALHAFSLEFKDISQKQIFIEAPLPKDFIEALNMAKVGE